MTNRDRIMEELASMTNGEFYAAFADNSTTMAMEDQQCADCEATHGGCPCPGDAKKCVWTTEEWLGMECLAEKILS